jgi:hypothetical protein
MHIYRHVLGSKCAIRKQHLQEKYYDKKNIIRFRVHGSHPCKQRLFLNIQALFIRYFYPFFLMRNGFINRQFDISGYMNANLFVSQKINVTFGRYCFF